MDFFEDHIVKDIVAFLSLAINNHDAQQLRQICNKGILCLKNKQRDWAIKKCQDKHISVFDAIDEQMKYVNFRNQDCSSRFRDVMTKVSKANSDEAISIILESGYKSYLNEKHFNIGKIEILQILAKQEPTIERFLNRMRDLQKLLRQDFIPGRENQIILSTIHASKGLEYDTVYMVDVYEGQFPSSKPNIFCRSKDSPDGEQEERRLLYVGITRAKNKLHFFEIKEKVSLYIGELFPETRELQLQKENEERRKSIEETVRRQAEKVRRQAEKMRIRRERELREQETLKKEREEARKRAREERKRCDELDYIKRRNEVIDKFDQDQQVIQIRDSKDNRWIKCERCGKIKESCEFGSYGGTNRINLGICLECSRQDTFKN